VSFAAITLCVASQRVFIFVYFFIELVRKLLDTNSYMASKLECTFLLCVCMCVRARALRCADMSYIIKKGTKNFWSRIGDHVE
jgi:hypothetical protein